MNKHGLHYYSQQVLYVNVSVMGVFVNPIEVLL